MFALFRVHQRQTPGKEGKDTYCGSVRETIVEVILVLRLSFGDCGSDVTVIAVGVLKSRCVGDGCSPVRTCVAALGGVCSVSAEAAGPGAAPKSQS